MKFTRVTILILFCLILLGLFAGIVEDVVNSETIVQVDLALANLMSVFRSAELTKFFLSLTFLAEASTVVILGVAVLLVLWLRRLKSFILPFLVSLLGSQASTYLGKLIVSRDRPEMALYVESSFSFPSGHSSMAIAFYGFLAYILFKSVRTWPVKLLIVLIALVFTLLIALSRIYLGVHFLSDVIAGYLLGAIWLTIAIVIFEYNNGGLRTKNN